MCLFYFIFKSFLQPPYVSLHHFIPSPFASSRLSATLSCYTIIFHRTVNVVKIKAPLNYFYTPNKDNLYHS